MMEISPSLYSFALTGRSFRNLQILPLHCLLSRRSVLPNSPSSYCRILALQIAHDYASTLTLASSRSVVKVDCSISSFDLSLAQALDISFSADISAALRVSVGHNIILSFLYFALDYLSPVHHILRPPLSLSWSNLE